jgi:hypothetical protein
VKLVGECLTGGVSYRVVPMALGVRREFVYVERNHLHAEAATGKLSVAQLTLLNVCVDV